MIYEAFHTVVGDLDSATVAKLFVSSRDDTDVVLELKKYTNVYIRATDNRDDIARFVAREVKNSNRPGKVRRLLSGRGISEEVEAEIISTLMQGAQGM